MNSMVIKALGVSGLLIVATLAMVLSMDIDLSDPINAMTILGAIVIATATFGVTSKYISQMKTDKAEGELTDENWDGIGEYKNELPSGWAYTFLGTLIYTVWYFLIGFPLNAYSQIGEYNEEVKAYHKKFEEVHKTSDIQTLQSMGQSIFLVQCAPCHGNTGDGLNGKAHDFSKRMSKEQVLHVINNGQNQLGYPMGEMPAGMAMGADAEAIAVYVAGGMKGEQPAAYGVCAGCHGADGQGMGGMAPSIAMYDEVLVGHVLEHGKKGVIGKMPSFKTRMTPIQEKALTVYIQSLTM